MEIRPETLKILDVFEVRARARRCAGLAPGHRSAANGVPDRQTDSLASSWAPLHWQRAFIMRTR
jgi:hypothetical protein